MPQCSCLIFGRHDLRSRLRGLLFCEHLPQEFRCLLP